MLVKIAGKRETAAPAPFLLDLILSRAGGAEDPGSLLSDHAQMGTDRLRAAAHDPGCLGDAASLLVAKGGRLLLRGREPEAPAGAGEARLDLLEKRLQVAGGHRLSRQPGAVLDWRGGPQPG